MTVEPTRLLAAGILIAYLVAPASAGSVPWMITDPPRDVALGPASVPLPEVDLLAVTLLTSPTTIEVVFAVLNVSHRTFEGESLAIVLTYRNAEFWFADVSYRVDASGREEFAASAAREDGSTRHEEVPGSVDVVSSRVHLYVPRAFFGDGITHTKASTFLSPPGPNVGTVVRLGDSAPDDGYGPDARFT